MKLPSFLLLIALQSACTTPDSRPRPLRPQGHLGTQATPPAGRIPEIVPAMPKLTEPKTGKPAETFNIVASKLPIHDLLFVLGRDARINLDIHPGIHGEITLNALDQTLPQIMQRISQQAEIRWSYDKGMLAVMPDAPYLKIYPIDYFNLSRKVRSNVAIANTLSATGGSIATKAQGDTGNSSATHVETENQHEFWRRLEANLRDLLGIRSEAAPRAMQIALPHEAPLADARNLALLQKTLAETAKTQAQTAALHATSTPAVMPAPENRQVIVHPETGTVVIKASEREHGKVADYLTQVQAAARRQVLIEATVVEVALSDQYQAGVDWNRLATGSGWGLGQQLTAGNLATAPLGIIQYNSATFGATLRMLETFGDTRVLSSPKVMALNNQTALMKVVEEQVYFTLEVKDEDRVLNGTTTTRTSYNSTLHTVPVGLMLQVTPQISDIGGVALNIRPTITNISGYVDDPAFALWSAGKDVKVRNQVPTLQVREFDSTLQIPSGQIAVLGGLIQDVQSKTRAGIPGLSRLPWVGDFFSYRDDLVRKVELVIFLRPVRVTEGLSPSLAAYRDALPSADFFSRPPATQALP